MNEEPELISVYTREQALEDGILFDVSKQAREAGIRFPVAVTAGVHGILNDIGESGCQSYEGRLWDLLTMFRFGLTKSRGDTVYFSALFLIEDGKHHEIKFWARCGPGDTMSPAITIMLTTED